MSLLNETKLLLKNASYLWIMIISLSTHYACTTQHKRPTANDQKPNIISHQQLIGDKASCDTPDRRLLFTKMQQIIKEEILYFTSFMKPFQLIPLSMIGQLQRSHYTIQFNKALFKRLNFLQSVLESCPILKQEFLAYRSQLAENLNQILINLSYANPASSHIDSSPSH
jgi:hypothetical protein